MPNFNFTYQKDGENEQLYYKDSHNNDLYIRSCEDFAPAIVSEETGNPVAINDAANCPIRKLKINLEPIQDLNGYSNPWPGGGGKNLFDASRAVSSTFSRNGETFTNVFSDTRTTFSFQVQAYVGVYTLIVQSSIITVTATGRYSATITINDTPDRLRIKHNGSAQDMYIDFPFTLTGTYTISITASKIDPTTVGGLVISDIQIEAGSTATSYAPYSNICPISGWDSANVTLNGTTHAISLPSTVYGGSVDVVSGEGSATRAMVTLDENQPYSIGIGTDRNRITWDGYQSVGKTAGTFVSDMLTTIPNAPGGYGTADWQIFGSTSAPRMWIVVPSNIDTVDKFKAYVADNPITVCYELATPIPFTIDPVSLSTLKGNNTFTTDGTDIELKYVVDTKTYIDNIVNNLGG